MGQCRQFCFFFQAEDGIRDAQESRGLGDVYKRQELTKAEELYGTKADASLIAAEKNVVALKNQLAQSLSLIHI